MVKSPPAVQETWVQSLGQDDPLEKEMATHSSTLAWRTPWTGGPGGLQSMGSQKSQTQWVANIFPPDWLVMKEQGGAPGLLGSAQITTLHLGSCLSSCPRTQSYVYHNPKLQLYVSLKKNCLIVAVLSFDCSSFVSAFLHFPDSNYLDLLFGTQGRSVRLKSLSYTQEMGDTERICMQKGPTESRSVSPGEREASISFLTEKKPFCLSHFATSAWPWCLPGLSY